MYTGLSLDSIIQYNVKVLLVKVYPKGSRHEKAKLHKRKIKVYLFLNLYCSEINC